MCMYIHNCVVVCVCLILGFKVSSLGLDEVTRTYYSAVDNDLAAVCHMLPWSRGQPLSLTDPLWSQLDQFVVPAMTVCAFA